MSNVHLHTLFGKKEIYERVSALAAEISRDYRDSEPVLIGVLKGAFVFLADLMREMTIPVRVDFVRLASYGDATESSGTVSFTKDIELPIENRDVIVVEDIVDSGVTLKYLMDELARRGPRSMKLCAFLDKRHRRETDVSIDYTGFVIDDGFVVGYGLDWAESYRYLPDICIVEADEDTP